MSFNNVELKTINWSVYPPTPPVSNIGAYYSYVQTIANTFINGQSAVSFDTLLSTSGTVGLVTTDHSTFTNNTGSTKNYQVSFTVSYAPNSELIAQYECSAWILQTSLGSYQFGETTCLNNASPASTTISSSAFISLNNGDSFSIQAYQNSGSSLLSIPNYCYLQIVRMN